MLFGRSVPQCAFDAPLSGLKRWYRGAVTAILTAALLMLSPTAVDDESWRTVTVYEGLASLEVPADWAEISPELLDFFAIRAAETSGGRSAETYQYGFRPERSDVGFELPQVLIQVRESGRIPYGQFLRLPSLTDVETSQGDFLNGNQGPFIKDVHIDGLFFDVDRKCLLVNSTLDLTIEGLTSVRSASFLTERGLFVVHCYDRLATLNRSAEIFDRVIQSVQLADDIRYQPRWQDRLSSRSAALLLFLLAAGAGVVALIHHLRARPAAPEVDTPPPGS